MFNYQMSYAELSTALNNMNRMHRLLTVHEITCIENSLKNPFLKALIYEYPFLRSAQTLLQNSLTQQEQEAAEHDLICTNVHDIAFAGSRERTARYLQKQFPATGRSGLMEKLQDFVKNSLVNTDVVNCTPLKGACFPSSNINKLILLDFLF
ncbi:MAG: hypothetical protein FJ161_05080 [Gammaproteobacteria bacterium]|nr:hypothetical protein [Gammaproteobacteria bacterium]